MWEKFLPKYNTYIQYIHLSAWGKWKKNIYVTVEYLQYDEFLHCFCLAICHLQGDFRHKSSFVIWKGEDYEENCAEWKMWHVGRPPCCLTTELPQFMLGALNMTEIQPLKFAKGDKISQDNNMSDHYTCRDWDSFVNFYHPQLNYFAKLWSCYFPVIIAWF